MVAYIRARERTIASQLNALPSVTLSPLTQKYVRVKLPRAVLAHVLMIDGTGEPAVDDQNVAIEGGKIVAVQPGTEPSADNGPNQTRLATTEPTTPGRSA